MILRPFREHDLADVQEFAQDPEVTRYLRWGPNRPEETLRFIERAIAGARVPDPQRFDLAIVERESVRVCGSLSLERRVPGLVEIGYCFARPVWGSGYATEAVSSAMRFADATFKGGEVFGLVAPGNDASERVLARCGFTLAEDRAQYTEWMDGLCATARVFRRPLSGDL